MLAIPLGSTLLWLGAAWCGAAPGDPTRASEQRIHEALARPMGVSFTDTPLRVALRSLAESHGFNVVVDSVALEASGIDQQSCVSCAYSGIALRSILRLLLEPLELTYLIRDGAVFVTTIARAETEEEAQAYYVGDLLRSRESFSDLAQTLTSCVAPESWDEGTGPVGNIRWVGSVMVVRQSQPVHEKLRECLAAMRAAQPATSFEERVRSWSIP